MLVKRTTIIEGCALLAIGVLGLAGGITLYLHRDARTQSSLMGPGTYVLIISAALILTAVVYAYLSLEKAARAPAIAPPQSREPWVSRIVIAVFGAFAVYAYLIELFGYVVPTILFLLVEFRLLGVRSWKSNVLLTAVVAAAFYIVFVRYCEMVFPHGAFFE